MSVPPSLTKEGYEIQFGTNFVGHALLIKLLLPLMEKTQADGDRDVRIVNVTSQGYTLHPKGGILFPELKSTQEELGSGMMGGYARYGQSKLANLLYAKQLVVHYPQFTVTSVHPGIVGTDLYHKKGFLNKMLVFVASMGKVISPAEGAWNQLWAATGRKEDVVKNGGYYEPVGKLPKLEGEGGNEELGRKLWEWTEKELENWK
jgi:NAD(P)-dependent dehydrogenase (short-subunit alcohol dehydrogenase family)